MRIEVLHGPNLNVLGTREPDVYGDRTLEQVNRSIREAASELDVEVDTFQSNHEGALIDRVQETGGDAAGFLVNAGGLTHTSVSLRDALVAMGRPFVEVHMSNVGAREPFRRESLLSDVAIGTVNGFGVDSYLLGLRGLVGHLRTGKRG